MPIIVASARRKVNTLSFRLAACLLALAFCAPAHSQVAVLANCTADTGAAFSTTTSCSATVTANSFVVALGFACQPFGGTTSCINYAFTTTQAISDNCGTPLTYTQRYHTQINNNPSDNWQRGDVSYNDAQTGACTGSHTFTLTAGSSVHLKLLVMVFSGVKTSSYFDVKNINQVSSICSLPGTVMPVSISPTGGGTYTAQWTVNISCGADAGGVAMIVAYYTTFNTEILMAYGLAGNFEVLQAPFTPEPDPMAGVAPFGIYEVAITGKATSHSYVF